MLWTCVVRGLLGGAGLLVFAGSTVAAPVTYKYVGTITGESGYSGVSAGDPITITVTYNPTTGPANFNHFTDGSTYSFLEDSNGAIYGLPWSTWEHVTASFDTYTWQNDLTGTYANVGVAQYVEDGGNCGAGCFTDQYIPFEVEQYADQGTQYNFAYWDIYASGSTNPDLTNGLSFPQTIDLAKGNQFGLLVSVTPAVPFQQITFDLNQNGIDIPVSQGVAEPTTLALLGIGLAGFGLSRRR